MINFGSATFISNDHGQTLGTLQASNSDGVGFTLKFSNISKFILEKTTSSTCTSCSLYWGNRTLLSNGSVSGVNCSINFTSPLPANDYIAYFWGCAASTYRTGGAPGFPIERETVIYRNTTTDSGFYAAFQTAQLREVENIWTEYADTLTQSIINITLNYPLNNSAISTLSSIFNTTLNLSGTNYSHQWKNATYNIWYSNGTLLNSTLKAGLTGNVTNVTQNITNLVLGNYLWNVYACYGNTTLSNCTWSTNNNTFSKASSINFITFNNDTYETKLETFTANISLAQDAQVSLVKLLYNGTYYTISNTTQSGSLYYLTKNINIPLNVNDSLNQTNVFYIEFTYDGNFVQTFGPYSQNSSFIKLIQCGAPYTTKTLNFTFFDEYTQQIINAASNKTTIYVTFKYWLGDGTVYKNYSFQNITSSVNNYTFCLYPWNSSNTFKTDMDMNYYAVGYRENNYYLRNSTLTNVSSDIFLYLLNENVATKMFLTFQNGVELLSGAVVTVQKYFVGLGQYKTSAILQTDDDGEATMWQELDKTYKYSIVQDGVLIGEVIRVSSCSVSPCSMTIMLTTTIQSAFDSYYNYYAENILSNLSYDNDTKLVTYSFIDTTGLANYFRLVVKQTKLTSVGGTICDTKSYSSAGTITCNMTGYDGDFIAETYISRSPEKLDKILGFFINQTELDELGLTGLLLTMVLIVTIVVAAAVLSKGNPSTILFFLAISILGTKLIGIFPFSWVLVVSLEVLIIWMLFKIKT